MTLCAVDPVPPERVSPERGPAVCSQCEARIAKRYYVCPTCGARLCGQCAATDRHCYPTSLAQGQETRVCPGSMT